MRRNGVSGTHSANVPRRRQTETANQASAHVRQNVAVKVRHDHNAISVRLWVLDNLKSGSLRCAGANKQKMKPDLQTDAVKQILVVLNVREAFRDLAAGR